MAITGPPQQSRRRGAKDEKPPRPPLLIDERQECLILKPSLNLPCISGIQVLIGEDDVYPPRRGLYNPLGGTFMKKNPCKAWPREFGGRQRRVDREDGNGRSTWQREPCWPRIRYVSGTAHLWEESSSMTVSPRANGITWPTSYGGSWLRGAHKMDSARYGHERRTCRRETLHRPT